MKKKDHVSVTDLGWWKNLGKRIEKELEWWYWYEKEGRGQGPDLKEIRNRQAHEVKK